MNSELAHAEIAIAAKWWRELLVRLHRESIPANLFAALPEHTPIAPERADAFEAALAAEIEATFSMDYVTWDTGAPLIGAGRRRLEVVGQRAPSEVVRAADFAGLGHVVRLLRDGISTAINPGRVTAYEGRKGPLGRAEVLETANGGRS